MCAGAMVNCRLGRVVFGCADPRGGAAGGAMNLLYCPGLLHRVNVTRGVCADDCLALLQSFFRGRRQAAANRPLPDVHGWPENWSMN